MPEFTRTLDTLETDPHLTPMARFAPRFLTWHFTHPPGPDPKARRCRTYYVMHPTQPARLSAPLHTLSEVRRAIVDWYGYELSRGAYTMDLFHLRGTYGVEPRTVTPCPETSRARWDPFHHELVVPSHWLAQGPERGAYGPHDRPLGITHVSTPHGQILRVSPLGYVSTRTTTRPANTPWKAITPVSVELAPTLDRPRVNFLTRELLTPEGTGIKV